MGLSIDDKNIALHDIIEAVSSPRFIVIWEEINRKAKKANDDNFMKELHDTLSMLIAEIE